MKKRTAGLFLIITLLAGCSGAIPSLPTLPGPGPQIAGDAPNGKGGEIRTFVRVRIPHRARTRDVHPSTISPLTQSVLIQIGALPTEAFNTTPSSPGCTVGSKGTTCTFAVRAPAGTDTFTVTTYSGVNASGSALDRGVATVPIVKGKANDVAITLGPVVTTTANDGPGSLRYAVGTANSGDTVLFLLPAGATIALAAPITITSTVTLAGPGATKLAISGGSTHQLFVVNGKATISGVSLTHGKAAVPGSPGGTIDNAGSLTLANDIVGNSTSVVTALRREHRALSTFDKTLHRLHPHTCSPTVSEGGAIYNAGALVTSHTQFAGNVAESDTATCVNGEGGAIFNDVTGSLSSTGDTFDGNSATAGGAVFNGGLGAVTFNGDLFEDNTGCTAATGCPTSGCTATGCTSNASGAGAAIWDQGVGITVVNSKFIGNVVGGPTAGSAGAGGALFLAAGSPTISNDTFADNVAGGGTSSCSAGIGGAITATVPIEIDNDVFDNNEAKGDSSGSGGAVAAQTGAITGSDDTFDANTVVASGGSCTTNSIGTGGAVSAAIGATFDNSTFRGNSVTAGANGSGGAIFAATDVLNGDTFTSNKAAGTGGGAASTTVAAGGAVVAEIMAKIGGSTFTSNAVTLEGSTQTIAAGGAVSVVSGQLVSGGDRFTSNTIGATTNTESLGGGVAVLSGTAVSTGDTFASNAVEGGSASVGGAIYAASNSLIENATISSNAVNGPGQAFGGGLAIGVSGILTNVTVTANTATSAGNHALGGGILDAGGAKISDSTVSHNTAGNSGGGIASIGSNAETLIATTVSYNAVTKASISGSGGGGIYELTGLGIGDSTIAGNTVATSGAGTAGGGGIFNGGDILAVGITVSGNAVTGSAPGGGGGILNGAGLLLMNSTIANNASSKDGGGVDVDSNDAVVFTNATLYKNAAAGHGGNIDNQFSLTEMTNSIVAGGTAAVGADVYNSSTLTSNDYNIVQTAVAGNALAGTTTHDRTVDPELLPLADNGGPTFTDADRSTSPGKAYIPYSSGMCGGVSVTVDQRGFTRGNGGLCDVGAYEYSGGATAIAHRTLPKVRVVHRGRGLRVAFPRVDARYVTRMMPIIPRSS